MAGRERSSAAELELDTDSESFAKLEPVVDPKSSSNPESDCESTYEPSVEP